MYWLKSNALSIIMAVVTIVAAASVANYKLNDFQDRLTKDESRIDSYNSIEVQNQISLAEIEKDIEYIKLQINLIPKS